MNLSASLKLQRDIVHVLVYSSMLQTEHIAALKDLLNYTINQEGDMKLKYGW
jgi:hypothetical protein